MANIYRAVSQDTGRTIEGTAIEIGEQLIVDDLLVYNAQRTGTLLFQEWKVEMIGKAMFKLNCRFCGKEFESVYSKTMYCSESCNRKYLNKEKRKKPVKIQSAGEIARLARAAGLSYGQYVAKMGL